MKKGRSKLMLRLMQCLLVKQIKNGEERAADQQLKAKDFKNKSK